MKFTDSLEQNISWASAHLGDRTKYEKFRTNELTAWELNTICQQYRAHRIMMSGQRDWYRFAIKRRDKRILKELDALLKDIYQVVTRNAQIDLSKYGVKQ